MRPNAILKLGFYPTPACVIEAIAEAIWWPIRGTVHALDPCCGEGEALQALIGKRRGATYGIELDTHRARKAAACLGRVITESFFATAVTPESFGLILLNPPYDARPQSRLERRFLRAAAPKLAPGGLLIYIIPENRLDKPTLEFLGDQFQTLVACRFPTGEYERFHQIVVMASRRGGIAGERTDNEIRWVKALDELRRYGFVVPVGEGPKVFTAKAELREALERELPRSDAFRRLADEIQTYDRVIPRSLMPPKKGVICMMLLGGMLDLAPIDLDGDPHLVKGFARKKIEKTETEDKVIEREVSECGVGLLSLKTGRFMEIGL